TRSGRAIRAKPAAVTRITPRSLRIEVSSTGKLGAGRAVRARGGGAPLLSAGEVRPWTRGAPPRWGAQGGYPHPARDGRRDGRALSGGRWRGQVAPPRGPLPVPSPHRFPQQRAP